MRGSCPRLASQKHRGNRVQSRHRGGTSWDQMSHLSHAGLLCELLNVLCPDLLIGNNKQKYLPTRVVLRMKQRRASHGTWHTVGACYALGRPEIAHCLQLSANLTSKLCLCPLITEGLCYVNILGWEWGGSALLRGSLTFG